MRSNLRKAISILMIMLMIIPLTWQVYAEEELPEDQDTIDVQTETVQPEPEEAHETLETPETSVSAESETDEVPAAPEPEESEVTETPEVSGSAKTQAAEDQTAAVSEESEAAEDKAAAGPGEPEITETPEVTGPAEPEADEAPAESEPEEPEVTETPEVTGSAETEAAEVPAATELLEKSTSIAPVTVVPAKKTASAMFKAVSTQTAATVGPESEAKKTITIAGTLLDCSEDSSGSGWTYEKDSGRIVLRDYTDSADITSDGTGVDIVSTGFNRIGALSCDGNINVIGTGVLLVDKVELAEGCSFNLLPLREYYGDDGGSVAVFLRQEDGSYMLMNGKVKGIIDEKLELPEDIRLVLPSDSLLELQALKVKVETDEDGNKTITRDLSGYSSTELEDSEFEYYSGHLCVGDLTLNKGSRIRNNKQGDIIASIIVGGKLVNEGVISGGDITLVQKDSTGGGLYSGSGVIENAFITFRTGQTTSINIKDSTLSLEQGDYTIEQLGLTGSSDLYHGDNIKIKNIKGDSDSSVNICSFDMTDSLKLTGTIDGVDVLIKSGITDLAAGLKFLNGGTVNNGTYGGPVFDYSGGNIVSVGTSGSVFIGPKDVQVPDPDSIPVVSFNLFQIKYTCSNIELKENMEAGQEYTPLEDYNAAAHEKQINYDELINTYFPEGLDSQYNGQSIIFEVLRYKDSKLSMTILGKGDGYEYETDSDGVFLIRMAYIISLESPHGGSTVTSTRASQTGSGNIGGNTSSIITGTGITRFSSTDPKEQNPDPVKPDPDPVKPDPDPVKPDPVKPDDPDPIKPDDPDPIKPDDPDPVKPDDPDPVRPAKEYSIAAVSPAGDLITLKIKEFDLNKDSKENAEKVPCYNLELYVNGVQVIKPDMPVEVKMDYELPEEFKDKPLYAVFANEDENSDEILKAVRAEYDEESGTLTFETAQTGEFVIAALAFDGEEFSPEFYDELEKTEPAKLFIKHLKEKKDDAEL